MNDREHTSVAIFWDYENCTPPSTVPGYHIVDNIRQIALRYGNVKLFKAYLELSEHSSSRSINLRSELQSCGVSLTDCPHNGKKDVADKMMIVDMIMYAIDASEPATIVLISGDRDFVYAVSVLRLRGCCVILVAPNTVHTSLRPQASVILDWEVDILGRTRTPTTQRHTDTEITAIKSSYGSHRRAQSSASTLVSTLEPQPTSQHLSALDISGASRPSIEPLQPAAPVRNPRLVRNVAVQTDITADDTIALTSFAHQTRSQPGVAFVNPPSATSAFSTAYISSQRDNATSGRSSSNISFVPDLNVHLKNLEARSVSRNSSRLSDVTLSYSDHTSDHTFPSTEASGRTNGVATLTLQQKQTQKPHMVPPISKSRAAHAFLPMTDPSVSHEGRVQTMPKAEADDKSNSGKSPAIVLGKGPPLYFNPLIQILQEHSFEKCDVLLRSQVALSLKDRFPEVYKSAGVMQWKEYAALAETEGLITLGGIGGKSWVSLRPEWRNKDATVSVDSSSSSDLPRPVESASPDGRASENTLLKHSIYSATNGSAPVRSMNMSPQMFQEDISSRTRIASTRPRPEAPTSPSPPVIPPHFLGLLQILEGYRAAGISHPLRTVVNLTLMQQNRNVFQQAGVKSWSEYAAVAEGLGLITLGGSLGNAWVSLCSV